MIVFLKKALALTITEILNNNVRVITTAFNEETANRPQGQLEVRVLYRRSIWTRPQRLRTYEFTIIIASKNLRTDDEVQDLTDKICFGLLGANRFGNHLEIVEDSFESYNEGLWYYEITLRLTYPAELLACEEMGFHARTFDSLVVSIYPDYGDHTFESDAVILFNE